ncbi:MAG TPA: hypothetical protein VLD19_12350 [Chitinophagaceae bacterium]|nr:hypothetical protein [Chitinophagaceae bacterium]
MHGAVHAFMEPFFQAAGVVVERNGFGDAAVIEAELSAERFDKTGMGAAADKKFINGRKFPAAKLPQRIIRIKTVV